MKSLLKYYAKILKHSTQNIKVKEVLIDKPWAFLDDDAQLQKLIFRKDNRLILSKNGVVSEGTWEYIPEAKALLINRVADKLLLKEQFIDKTVLIVKKDGTDNDFYAFANENLLPNYNVAEYLNQLKCEKFNIKEIKLISGNRLQMLNPSFNNISYLQNHPVELIDNAFDKIELPDGKYMTKDRQHTINVENNRIKDVKMNRIIDLVDGQSIEIEGGLYTTVIKNLHKTVTIIGQPVPDSNLKCRDGSVFEVRRSVIMNIVFQYSYNLSGGNKVVIEQKLKDKISKGDMIIESEPIFPLPDGVYKVQGKLFKRISVKDSIIV